MKKMLICGLSLCLAMTAVAKNVQLADRVEPMAWWAGMAHTELQLMLHGTDVAACNVAFADDALPIVRIEKTDNPNYLFVYVDTKNAQPGIYQLVITNGKKRQKIDYLLRKRADGSAERSSFGPQDAVYLLMPDRFANGDPSNDNVAGYRQGVVRGDWHQRQGGDIQGIIDHLGHIADLGATALWTTPLFDDNDTRYSYHHYACTDYYKIDPRFGVNDDYKRLADSCHVHGLKLIMDVVPNHCGIEHWWMKDLPAHDWFHQWPEFTRTNHNVSIWTNPDLSEYDITLLEKGWFDNNMPDYNLANPLVFDYLRQAYTYWIEFAGIDGLRIDTYPYNDIWDAARLMRAFNAEYPNLTIVGECWVKSPSQNAFFQMGAKNKNGFDSGLQSVMDFTLRDIFDWSFKEDEGWDKGTLRYYNHFAQDFVYPDVNFVMNMLDNHDMDRYAELMHRDARLVKMGFAVISTIRGYPQFFYGDEVMMHSELGSYEGSRHTFPGGWNDDEHNAFDPAQRTAEENDIYNYLRNLLHFRKGCTALHTGKMRQFLPNDGVYVYFRYNADDTVMVVMNNRDEERTVDLQRYNEFDIVGKQAIEVPTQTTIDLGETLRVPAKTVLVLHIQK